jgi:hypothetical protein
MSSGGAADQARTALDEAGRLFLTTAAAKCSLEEVLREAGYEQEGGGWVISAWVPTDRHCATVPA